MEILALDIGAARVGVARASTEARLAEPLKTIKTNDALEYLLGLAKNKEIQAIVVGLPRNLSGDETQQTQWVRQWVKNTMQIINKPFYWQDEALTSQKAKSGADEHSLAATIILQDFLDTPDSKRIMC